MSVLNRLFVPERYRPRAAVSEGDAIALSRGETYTIPTLVEVAVEPAAEPLFVTNMRGTFVRTARSSRGTARYSFSKVSIDEERQLIHELYRVLRANSEAEGWQNRCKSLAKGLERVESFGLEAHYVVLSSADVMPDGKESEVLEHLQALGVTSEMDGLQVLVSGLPKGVALITAVPSLTGIYTRIGDHLGIMVHRAHESIVMVADDMVG